MHPSPSADTCGPFFPNFRYSIFPPRCGLLLRCSQFEEWYGPGQKNECLTLILAGGRVPTRRFYRVPHPCAFVGPFSNFHFSVFCCCSPFSNFRKYAGAVSSLCRVNMLY